ncbi:hypothetical protein BSF43_18750 [Pseudomonas ogarae]|uniref:hypothetical protein n=1 Tax=Pseudomonas ogarae (strain DSM 112162 / CECT 30235 / F113) TaxID=1114970 RepID=UPI000BB332D6|nr:hypothetical protein [Pseudomonas ogarae]PBJ12920.1 hypothetical protein BSF43_18750 [Pseudomonas ogarae]
MTNKISIKGVPRKFDPTELAQRQAGYHNVYKMTDQCTQVVRGDIPYDFLAKVVAMSNEGYILTNKYPISTAPTSYHCAMIKPLTAQQADLEVINERIKQEYITELECERQEYRELLTQQLLDKALEKEAKKVEDAHKKLMVNIAAEVNDVFGELIILE